jgi:hypothetical protein
MDPNATYDDFLYALKRGRIGTASDKAEELSDWLNNGGFVPDELKKRKLSAGVLVEMFSNVNLVLMWARADLEDD